MEKISFGKGDSGDWGMNYRTSNIVNPDLLDKSPKSEGIGSKSILQKDAAGSVDESNGEKNPASQTERKKHDDLMARKLEEEHLAQQRLLQTFYSEKLRIELSPEKFKDSMKSMAERSIEQLMSREGSSLKLEWKSELHQFSLAISMEAYDKLNGENSRKPELVGSDKS
ncbi:hypothetical protein [Saccharibacillus deserti]|uniref:hypothetical protein n=1 Tax=Saccharibacillus deserti TaxID=1634444 RepID=UPI001551F6D7|nr:hypothetical protein [Saccharibacillus deserti]